MNMSDMWRLKVLFLLGSSLILLIFISTSTTVASTFKSPEKIAAIHARDNNCSAIDFKVNNWVSERRGNHSQILRAEITNREDFELYFVAIDPRFSNSRYNYLIENLTDSVFFQEGVLHQAVGPSETNEVVIRVQPLSAEMGYSGWGNRLFADDASKWTIFDVANCSPRCNNVPSEESFKRTIINIAPVINLSDAPEIQYYGMSYAVCWENSRTLRRGNPLVSFNQELRSLRSIFYGFVSFILLLIGVIMAWSISKSRKRKREPVVPLPKSRRRT